MGIGEPLFELRSGRGAKEILKTRNLGWGYGVVKRRSSCSYRFILLNEFPQVAFHLAEGRCEIVGGGIGWLSPLNVALYLLQFKLGVANLSHTCIVTGKPKENSATCYVELTECPRLSASP